MEKKRVMIVDDEESFLKITKLNLEDTGAYEVMAISDAKNLITNVHVFKPDIILLDLLMPSIGGVEACQMLNDDEIGKNTPIIIISALDKLADVREAYKAGVVDYIVKPVEKKELVAKIEKALEWRKG